MIDADLASLTLRPAATGVRMDIRAIPRSPRNSIEGPREGRLVVRVTAPPVDDAANAAVVAAIAAHLDLPKRAVRIVSGATARNKTVEIAGLDVETLRRRITIRS